MNTKKTMQKQKTISRFSGRCPFGKSLAADLHQCCRCHFTPPQANATTIEVAPNDKLKLRTSVEVAPNESKAALTTVEVAPFAWTSRRILVY